MKKAQLKGTATMSKESTEGMREIETLADKNQFKLANVWIKSNYRWGNIETQVFNLAIEHPEKHIDIQTNTVKYISKINISDVKALTTQSGQVNYLRASEAAASLRSAFIRIENKEKKKFSYINALERCDYENGQFTVVFTDSAVAAGYIFPQRDYTKVLQTVNVLSDATCIRLYQTLRSHCFGHIDKNGYYHYLVGVDELKLRIGLVNVNDPAFKKSEDKFGLDSDDTAVLEQIKNEVDPKTGKSKVPYKKFSDFKNRVLMPYLKEINQYTDISSVFNTIKTGRAVSKLDFLIHLNREVPNEEEISRRIELMNHFITTRDAMWTKQQLIDLLAAANYNVDIVRDKYMMLLNTEEGKVKNRFGWLMDAIQNDYNDDELKGTGNIIDLDSLELTGDVFDRAWLLYKKQTRKDMITKKVRREIESVGFEAISKAIANYDSVIDQNKENGFNRARMSGGVFFSGAYKEYLPDVFSKKTDEEKGFIPPKKNANQFLNTGRSSTDYAKMAEQEEMDKVLHGFN